MTQIDLGLINLERVIIHDVPKHRKNDPVIVTPNYSQNESEITDGLRLFFKGKINLALGGELAFKVCFCDSEEISSVPRYIKEILYQDEVFVEHSKLITERLFQIQAGTNSAGIILIIKGTLEQKPICIVMKLERDSGAQLRLNENTRTYNIEEVHDLMLTQKTKIFKIALFFDRTSFEIDYDGMLMDCQCNLKTKKEAKTFFMEDFLGCIAYDDPKIATQKFYNLTKSFIGTIDDAIIRAKYTQDLNSYLQRNQQTISPRQFAEEYFTDTAHKNSYQRFLIEKKFNFGAFMKENSLINNAIKKIIIDFENDISILGKEGSLDNVRLIPMENGFHKAEITSKIRSIK